MRLSRRMACSVGMAGCRGVIIRGRKTKKNTTAQTAARPKRSAAFQPKRLRSLIGAGRKPAPCWLDNVVSSISPRYPQSLGKTRKGRRWAENGRLVPPLRIQLKHIVEYKRAVEKAVLGPPPSRYGKRKKKAVIPECMGNYMPNPTAKTVNPLDQTACRNIALCAHQRKEKTGFPRPSVYLLTRPRHQYRERRTVSALPLVIAAHTRPGHP